MQYAEGKVGRVFTMRLEDGDLLPESLESFAADQRVECAVVVLLGGAGDGSRLVVGPEPDRGLGIVPLIQVLAGSQEIAAMGTLFPDESGRPVLHMHAALGREGKATVGCTRAGVKVWLVGEVVMMEILGTGGIRKKDPETGFQLLQFPQCDLKQ
jgi:predicted DNA-binding protein with PD1-like motif